MPIRILPQHPNFTGVNNHKNLLNFRNINYSEEKKGLVIENTKSVVIKIAIKILMSSGSYTGQF